MLSESIPMSERSVPIRVRVHVRDKGLCDGELVRADGDVLDIDFDPNRCPDTFPGDRRMLFVDGEVFTGQMEVDGRMVAKERVGRSFRYQFQVDKAACAMLSSARHCRRTFRVTSPNEPPVFATVALVEHGKSFAARLGDVSKLGVSVVVPRQDAIRLTGSETVLLRFALPGDAEPYELAGSVRNMGLLPKAIRYGIELDEERTENWTAVSERLERWVVESLRREMLDTPGLRSVAS